MAVRILFLLILAPLLPVFLATGFWPASVGLAESSGKRLSLALNVGGILDDVGVTNTDVADTGAHQGEQASEEKPRAARSGRDKVAAEKAAAPFVIGEQINYDISWSNFLVAGELTLQTRERAKVDGRDAFHVTAQAQSVGIVKALNYRLNDQYESFVDASSLVPFRGNKISHHGKKLVQSSFVIDPGGRTATLSDGKSIEVPKATYDMASVLFAIRGIDQTPGSSKMLSVIEDGKVYAIRAEAEAREKVYTRAGDYDAFRIAVKIMEGGKPSDAHKVRIYLTRDQHRLPVLITAEPPWGQVRIEMTSTLKR